jgi:adenylate kinase family enzyme
MNSTTQNQLPNTTNPNQSELVLIRGLPGSGKSTMAKVLAMVGYQHFEADMYFMQHGTYKYDASKIREAHEWCQAMTRKALASGKNVVVSNTFTTLREMAPYINMSQNIIVLEGYGRWTNAHGVPEDKIALMEKRWEALPSQ